MVNKSWDNIFVGREKELKALWEALRKSAPTLFGDKEADPEPQVVVLKGEPGVGKSRIVQEFYRRIAVAPDEGGLDPDDYWPDAFGDSAKSGFTELVNPVFEEKQTIKKTPPFIWWGVKWNTPISGRDGDKPQLGEQHNLKHLIAHKAGIKRRIEKVVKVAKAGLKAAISQVSFGWLDAGLLFDATDAAGSATTVKRAARNFTKGHDAALSMQEQGDDQLSKVKQYLHNIVHPPGVGKIRDAGTPLILWLDDVQWMLPGEVRLIQELFNPASRVNWPLLVVATYRSNDWNRHTMDSESQEETVVSKNLRFSDFVNSINKESVSKIEIEEKLDFAELLRVALPGLTAKQHKLLIEKTHSHPLVFRVAVTALLEDKFSFVDNDVSGKLTEDTEEELEGLINNEAMKFFFDKKLQHLDAVTKRVLKWSSCQGNRFLQQINNSIGEGLEINGEEIDEAIQIAINPEAIVQRIGTNNQNEFRQAIYRNLMLETFRTAGEKRKINEAIKSKIELWIQDDEKISLLENDEKIDLYLLAEEHLKPRNEDGELDIEALDFLTITHQIWLHAKIKLLHFYIENQQQHEQLCVAKELVRLNTSLQEGLPFTLVDNFALSKVLLSLVHLGNLDEAEQFAKPLRLVVDNCSMNNNATIEAAASLSSALSELDEELPGAINSAYLYGKKAVRLQEESIAIYGETETAVDNLCVYVDNLSQLEEAQSKMKDARDGFNKAIKLCKKAISQYGESRRRLDQLNMSLNGLGLLNQSEGFYDDAKDCYIEVLLSCERNVDDMTSQQVADYSSVIGNISVTDECLGNIKESEEGNLKQVKIIEQVLDKYGETPYILDALSNSYLNYSILCSANDNDNPLSILYDPKVCAKYSKLALKSIHRSMTVFGITKERLNNKSRAHYELFKLNIYEENFPDALDHLESSTNATIELFEKYHITEYEAETFLNLFLGSAGTELDDGELGIARELIKCTEQLLSALSSKFDNSLFLLENDAEAKFLLARLEDEDSNQKLSMEIYQEALLITDFRGVDEETYAILEWRSLILGELILINNCELIDTYILELLELNAELIDFCRKSFNQEALYTRLSGSIPCLRTFTWFMAGCEDFDVKSYYELYIDTCEEMVSINKSNISIGLLCDALSEASCFNADSGDFESSINYKNKELELRTELVCDDK